ncbi:MAG: carbohydrate ABC transporter permease [Anaerolineae bacterium]|nr:carbohydrate ABC transporter permease [Anaerolineae bacterium]
MATANSTKSRLGVGHKSESEWRSIQRQQHRRQFLNRLLLTIVTGVIVFIFFYPIWFWVTASFKTFTGIFQMPPQLLGFEAIGSWWSTVIGGRSYLEVVHETVGANAGTGGGGTVGYYIVPFLVNSAITGLLSTLVVISVATPTAYALSRFNPSGKQNIIFFILSTRFMPAFAAVLPLTQIYRFIGWDDTRIGLVLAHVLINLPLAILLIKSFFDDVPTDLDDAAMVDGCNRWGAFWRIVIRYVIPGMGAAAVLCLIFSWNEFLFSLYLVRIPDLSTLPVFLSGFDTASGGTEWGFLAAAGTAAMIPVFIFILFVQRSLIRGLTLGAVRG